MKWRSLVPAVPSAAIAATLPQLGGTQLYWAVGAGVALATDIVISGITEPSRAGRGGWFLVALALWPVIAACAAAWAVCAIIGTLLEQADAP